MRLTTMTDYSLRLLMYLGENPDRLCTISEIAQAYAISQPHLMKVTNRLSRAGWIETIRGKNGGMRLAHEPDQISIGAVVRDTENDLALVECMGDKQDCTLIGRCRLPRIMADALELFMDHLDQFTLADLLPVPGDTAGAPGVVPIKMLSARSVS